MLKKKVGQRAKAALQLNIEAVDTKVRTTKFYNTFIYVSDGIQFFHLFITHAVPNCSCAKTQHSAFIWKVTSTVTSKTDCKTTFPMDQIMQYKDVLMLF